MSTARAKTTTSPTLHDYLAARHALTLLESDAPADAPDDAILAEAAQAVGHLDLAAGKLALLRASLRQFDVVAAARRLTDTQARATLGKRSTTPRKDDEEGALTVASLDALPPEAWAECARWLIEQEGVRLEPRPFSRREGLLAWRGEHNGHALIVCAWRQQPDWPLLEDDVRHLTALSAGDAKAQVVIITPAEATVGARLLARRMQDVRLLDRTALATTLAGLATAYEREQARSQDEAKLRAKAASAARKKLLSALTAIVDEARAEAAPKKASGRVAVRKAAEQVEQARRLAAQALMAWETLLAEWLATFGERPARDGSLAMDAEPATYTELGERAEHLKKPLLDALRTLSKTPGEGDLGYAAWRLACGEELAARCAALRWRTEQVDPAQWQDFAAASSDRALQEATRSDNAAAHAAARAQHARKQLIERAGAF